MKVSREEAERNKRTLQQLLRKPQNKECADCTAKGPTWSAINWGVFVCIKCAGIHRKLGVHISKVKSCTLDDWNAKDVELVTRVQNAVQKKMYEHGLPSNRSKPNEHDDIGEIERFIRNKYEKRAWMRPGAEKGAAGILPNGLPKQDVGSSPATPSSEVSSSPSSTNGGHVTRSSSSNQRQRLRLENASKSASATSNHRTEGGFSGIARRHSPATPTSRAAPTQPMQPSQDDLLSFDAPEQNVSNTDHAMESFFGNGSVGGGGGGGGGAAAAAAAAGSGMFPNQQSRPPQNNGNFASMNMNTSPTGSTASNQGSKNDILSLFDQPVPQPMQYGPPPGQNPMMMMNGGSPYYGMSPQGMPPSMGNVYGYGMQMSPNPVGQYGYPNAGGQPMMYNSNNVANGGFQQQPQQQPQQQSQQQQFSNIKW